MCFRPPSAQQVTEPCPKCEAMKKPLAVCPNCGFVPEVDCPKCGTKNPVTGEQCAKCGYKAPKMPPPPGQSASGAAGPKVPPPPGQSGGAPRPKAPPAPPKAPPAPPKKPE